jgi:ribonuclease D
MTIIPITESADLRAFCERQSKSRFVTIDTEFLREKTYWPVLCLVQAAGENEAVAIDVMAEGLDCRPLYELLLNDRVLKVFHAARQDLEIFYHLIRGMPAPIFDTQVAAMVCGFGDQVGYETIVAELVGVKLDKASRFADWTQRPLTQKQLSYALDDVIHLRGVYMELQRHLDETGRSDWLAEEMATLTDPTNYRMDPDDAWKRVKSRGGNKRFLALMKTVAAWRETEAQRRDIPRNRILRDDSLQDIAAHAPRNVAALARTRGISKGFAEGKMGAALLEAVEHGLSLPNNEIPTRPKRDRLPPGIGPLTDLLKVLLKQRCEETHVASRLVASADDLMRIAADDHADVPALRGWRRELFGADALELKHGRIGLYADGSQVKIKELR